jgi:hypothetical protein
MSSYISLEALCVVRMMILLFQAFVPKVEVAQSLFTGKHRLIFCRTLEVDHNSWMKAQTNLLSITHSSVLSATF